MDLQTLRTPQTLRTLTTTIFEELAKVASTNPQERLPKEDQTRCILYSVLRPEFGTVCAERGYGPVEKSRIECDLWAENKDEQAFFEIKNAWSAKTLKISPPEQFAAWMADLAKLEGLSPDSDRYFLLVGFFDEDPLAERDVPAKSFLDKVNHLHPERLLHRQSTRFRWRQESIQYMAVWIWCWPEGIELESWGNLAPA